MCDNGKIPTTHRKILKCENWTPCQRPSRTNKYPGACGPEAGEQVLKCHEFDNFDLKHEITRPCFLNNQSLGEKNQNSKNLGNSNQADSENSCSVDGKFGEFSKLQPFNKNLRIKTRNCNFPKPFGPQAKMCQGVSLKFQFAKKSKSSGQKQPKNVEILNQNLDFPGKFLYLFRDLDSFLLEFDLFYVTGENSVIFSYGKNSAGAEAILQKNPGDLEAHFMNLPNFHATKCQVIYGFYLQVNEVQQTLNLYVNNLLLLSVTVHPLEETHVKLVILSDLIILSSKRDLDYFLLNDNLHMFEVSEAGLTEKPAEKTGAKSTEPAKSETPKILEEPPSPIELKIMQAINSNQKSQKIYKKYQKMSDKLGHNLQKQIKFCKLESNNMTLANGKNLKTFGTSLIGKILNFKINNLGSENFMKFDFKVKEKDEKGGKSDVLDEQLLSNYDLKGFYLPLQLYQQKIQSDKELTLELDINGPV